MKLYDYVDDDTVIFNSNFNEQLDPHIIKNCKKIVFTNYDNTGDYKRSKFNRSLNSLAVLTAS